MNSKSLQLANFLTLFLGSKLFLILTFIEVLFITFVLLNIDNLNVYSIESSNILYFYISLIIFNIFYFSWYLFEIKNNREKKDYIYNYIQVFSLNLLFLSYIFINETFNLYVFLLYFILKSIKFNSLKYENNELKEHTKMFFLYITIEGLLAIITYFIFGMNIMINTLFVVNALVLIYFIYTSFNVFIYFYNDLISNDSSKNMKLMAEMMYKRSITMFFYIVSFLLLLYYFDNNIEVLYYLLALKILFYFNDTRNDALLDDSNSTTHYIYDNNLKKSSYL